MKMKKVISSAMATSLLATGLIGAGVASPAFAEECKGENSSEITSVDAMNGGQTEEIKVDSCKTQEMIDAYANVKDAAGLAGLLGSKYWPVGVSGGVLLGWAWANQNALKDCAKDGNGVTYTQINGIVTGCSSQ